MKCATGCGKEVPDTKEHYEIHGNYCKKCSERATLKGQKRDGKESAVTPYRCVTCKKKIRGSRHANYEKEGWECDGCTPYLKVETETNEL